MIHLLVIPNFRPVLDNEMVGRHWAVKSRRKKADREIVAAYAQEADIPRTTGKRRVGLRMYLGKGERRFDPLAPFKSLLDALVACQLLVDDSDRWCEVDARVEFNRDWIDPRCVIVLEDLE